MRGHDIPQTSLFSFVDMEKRVPVQHPLRKIRPLVDRGLVQLEPRLSAMYSPVGRVSIAPEKLIRALLIQILYSVRSERQLVEQLDYNILFRWFVGLGMDDAVWNHSTFSKNRDRLLEADLCQHLLRAVYDQAIAAGLVSDEHFSVDGTLLDAWAATGNAERDGAIILANDLPGSHRKTIGADKGYDRSDLLPPMRGMNITFRPAQKKAHSAIDGRTTRHPGYTISQTIRKRVEEPFGWAKVIGPLRKLHHRGVALVDSCFALTMTGFNLVRMKNLMPDPTTA